MRGMGVWARCVGVAARSVGVTSARRVGNRRE